MRFSVVVPLYNKRRYIRRAVDSVLSQTDGDFELIVIDDGSTDGGHEMLADIDDLRLRLIRQTNAGEGAARNRGVAEAREEWITFLDADDFWLPNHLAETAKIIVAFPECGLVATNFREVLNPADAQYIAARSSNLYKIDYFLEAAKRIGRVNSSNVSVRRTALEKIGGFGAYTVGADLHCWARLALSVEVALSDRVTSVYVRGVGGVMQQLELAKAQAAPIMRSGRLADISPSVAALCQAIDGDAALGRRAGLRAYINARVFSCIYGGWLHGDMGAARHFAGFLVPPYRAGIVFARSALLLPDAWLLTALKIARFGKDMLRRG